MIAANDSSLGILPPTCSSMHSQTTQGQLSDPYNDDLSVCSRGILPVELYYYVLVSLNSSPACSVLLTRMLLHDPQV